MGFIGPLAAVIGAGAAVAGGIASAQAGRRQARDAQRAADLQSQFAEENALLILDQSNAEEIRLRRSFGRRLAETQAGFAASGVQFTGTPLDVLADQAMEAEEEILLSRLRGRLLARRELIASQGAQSQGGLLAASARAQGTAGLIGGIGSAFATLLSATSTT